jgi:hypothetical protein
MAAATTTGAEKRRQEGDKRALFDAVHGELASEAHAVARDFGVDVLTVAVCPDGGAVNHEFLGVAPVERVRRLLATDVTAMGPAELAVHAARLRAVRAALTRKLQGAATTEKKKQDVGGAVEVVGTTGAGSGSKTRRPQLVDSTSDDL